MFTTNIHNIYTKLHLQRTKMYKQQQAVSYL